MWISKWLNLLHILSVFSNYSNGLKFSGCGWIQCYWRLTVDDCQVFQLMIQTWVGTYFDVVIYSTFGENMLDGNLNMAGYAYWGFFLGH